MKLFLSGPFFNDEEVERINRVKCSLESLDFEVYSTSHRNPPIDLGSHAQKNRRFKLLCKEILKCDGVFAILDGRDPGTIWEMGYSFALGKPVVAFSDDEPYFSLMIEPSALYVTGFGDIDDRLLEYYSTGLKSRRVKTTGIKPKHE